MTAENIAWYATGIVAGLVVARLFDALRRRIEDAQRRDEAAEAMERR